MPTPRKSQKQIAQRYAGNLQYYRLLAPFRRLRLRIAAAAVFLGASVAIIGLTVGRSYPRLEIWNSSGGISQAHAGFARDCAQCHSADPRINPIKPATSITEIDHSCLRCHAGHDFHQADVVVDHSCTACHHEHLGTGPMQPVADLNCRSCHGDAAIMAASAAKGFPLSAHDFLLTPHDNLTWFQPPRPAGGCTRVIQSFDGDHPDFQIQRDHLSDPDTLKFNHAVHLTGAIPALNGHKLDCASCHQPDSRGAYMQSISFEKSCQACHALQIDPAVPDFQIPHPQGNAGVATVRNFILTLPTQYATYATEKLGLTGTADVSAFVGRHMEAIRARTREGSDLVKEVFYSDDRQVDFPGRKAQQLAPRALFPGCAYCHEVKPSASDLPEVTAPVIPDRWFTRAKFNHAAHLTLSCEACHAQVLQSTKTSDISLPDKASCVTCHSVKGGVISTCVTCHGFHNTAPSAQTADTSSLRNMMLGK